MDFIYRLFWRDHRLQYKHLISGNTASKLDMTRSRGKIWIPDIYFHNQLNGGPVSLTTPNAVLYVHPDGSLRLSIR